MLQLAPQLHHGDIKYIWTGQIPGAEFPETTVIGLEAMGADFTVRFAGLLHIFFQLSKAVFDLYLHGPSMFRQILDGKELVQFQITMADIISIHMNQAGLFHGIAQFCQHICLIGYIVIIDILDFGGTFHFVQLHPAVAKVFENVCTAEQSFIGKRCLCDNRYTGSKQPPGFGNHLSKIPVRYFDEIPEQAHGEITNGNAVIQNGLPQDAFIKLLRHVFPEPKHFGALDSGAVFGFG